ncbi:MAG: NAD(P)H-hydrate dehydratase [Chloroflexota bacterium]
MNAERRPVGFGRRLEDATRPPTRPHVPDGAVGLDDAAMQLLIPKRDGRGHKGTFGKVLVVAGSLDYAGAGLLVCRAAGRGGAGLVTLAVPESLQPLFAAKVIEATTMALPEDDLEEVDPEPALAKILDHEHDALVLGPGLRPSLATAELVRLILTTPEEPAAAPAVLDAEALRILATADEWWSAVTRPAILTPHPGEFARLRSGAGHESDEDGDIAGDDDARVRAANSAAVEWRQVVVLKGARTVIAAPDGAVAVAPFENPALATGGTGDVLAGTIGALLAQGLDPFGAARLGVYLHGLAGEAVRERLGEAGLLAGDLPDQIPLARKRLAALAERGRREKRIGFGVREADVAATVNPAGGVDDDDAEGRQQRPGVNPQPAPAGDGDAGR